LHASRDQELETVLNLEFLNFDLCLLII